RISSAPKSALTVSNKRTTSADWLIGAEGRNAGQFTVVAQDDPSGRGGAGCGGSGRADAEPG
ncbi:MAG: hypothetical protein KJ667_09070, partial [Alphaproteobacteria bacterium]|nr:hypothetical protein [Alphaproteobacteria bacterium]